jgi:predicted tellurium resistance membrane protein TerC
MNAAAKVIIGLILLVIGLGLLANGVLFEDVGIGGRVWFNSFITVLIGVIPPLLILVGLFVIWLELDEIKAEKELKAEEKKTTKTNGKDAKKK